MRIYLTHRVRSDIAGRAGKAGLARKAILVLWAGLLSSATLTATTANATTENKEAYKLYAYVKLINAKEFICLNALWTKESQWSATAKNKRSSAYGIPQLLNLKEKDPYKQIDLGLKYISTRYSKPCNAWAFFKVKGYY
jgi:resuscitation-promoting factor RpfB